MIGSGCVVAAKVCVPRLIPLFRLSGGAAGFGGERARDLQSGFHHITESRRFIYEWNRQVAAVRATSSVEAFDRQKDGRSETAMQPCRPAPSWLAGTVVGARARRIVCFLRCFRQGDFRSSLCSSSLRNISTSGLEVLERVRGAVPRVVYCVSSRFVLLTLEQP